MADSGRTRAGARGIGTLSVGELAGLWAILVFGLVLRTVGIGWGLPPATPEVAASGFRGSYVLDEGEILAVVAGTEPEPGKVKFPTHRFGALYSGLTLLGLEGAQRLDFFEKPWREAYRQMEPGGFERTFIVGRLITGLVDLSTVFLVFVLGRELAGASAGLWSSALVAVAPGHVLLANQIGNVPTATAFVMLAALLGVRLAKDGGERLAPWMGLAGGLAISAQGAAAPMVLAVFGAALWPHRKNVRGWMLAGGALIGAIFVVEMLLATEFREAMYLGTWSRGGEWAGPAMMASHLVNLARFSIGLPAALICTWGLWKLFRADLAASRICLAALAAGFLALAPQGWPMMRDHLPLIPFLALGAGYGLGGLRRAAQWPLGLIVLAFGLAGSLAQIHFMFLPHPANLALAVIQNSAAPGEAVSRAGYGIPPLDERVYPNGPDPLTEELPANPPAWVVTADLPVADYPEVNRAFLRDQYETIAIFRSDRILAWATFGEKGSPPDWKYTHPTTTLYRRRR